MSKLIFLSGSARKESVNKKLAKAAETIAKEHGAHTTYIDLADYDMPIFNEDWEAENGLPQAAKDLKELFSEHDGFLISTPEYNSSYPALLKNTLDWMSRPGDDNSNCFQGKVSAITAASPGGLGGIRVLPQIRNLLTNIAMHGTHVIPKQFALGGAFNAFDENGNLTDDNQRSALEGVVKQLVETSEALSH